MIDCHRRLCTTTALESETRANRQMCPRFQLHGPHRTVPQTDRHHRVTLVRHRLAGSEHVLASPHEANDIPGLNIVETFFVEPAQNNFVFLRRLSYYLHNKRYIGQSRQGSSGALPLWNTACIQQ